MKSAEGGRFWEPDRSRQDRDTGGFRLFTLLPLMLLCLTEFGCLGPTKRGDVERHLMSAKSPEVRHQEVVDSYLPACPDVVHVDVAGRPQLSGDYAIGPSGMIELGRGTDGAAVCIEGLPVSEAARRIATACAVPAQNVAVRVVEYNSQHLVLFGEVAGKQRVHAYLGQETVLELLQRTGGISRGAAPDNIYVVRAHVEDGQRPEVFHVDLAAIVEKKDEKTNIRLLPYDQIHVGETRQSRMESALPPWVRPIYQGIWGTRPDQPETKEPPPRTPRPRWLQLFPKKDKPEEKAAAPPPAPPDGPK